MRLDPRRWIQTVADFGPVVEGHGHIEIHHVVGRTYKQNKILIGPWFILPMPWELHGVLSPHPLNVTHFRHRFTEHYGLQKDLFARMVQILQNDGAEVPDPAVLTAIEATNR